MKQASELGNLQVLVSIMEKLLEEQTRTNALLESVDRKLSTN